MNIIGSGPYCVYAHINRVNGKMYIGQTGQKPERRWDGGNGYKNCTLFYRAIKKYGWDNFDHEIIASNLTQEEANHFEELLIKQLNTTDPEYGYNLKSGGENNNLSEETKRKIGFANKGHIMPEEQKQKLIATHKGKHLSDKHKQKLSKAFSGEKNPRYGKHPSEETLKKLSESHIGVNTGTDHPRAKAIYQFTVDGVFIKKWDYASQAATELHISNGNISSCCMGKYKSAGGYIWLFENDIKNINARVELYKINKQRKEPVVQLTIEGDFVKEWANAAEASRNFNANKDAVALVCRGKGKTACGYRWMYASDYYEQQNKNELNTLKSLWG